MQPSKSKTVNAVFDFIDEHGEEFQKVLGEAVAIQSVSKSPDYREECIKMAKWMVCKLESLGFEVEEIPQPPEDFGGGKKVRRPPIVLGRRGKDPSKPTVCYFGHLDVCPDLPQGEDLEKCPFELECVDGVLYGKGVSYNKGPTLCWLNAIYAFQSLGFPLPVNIKVVMDTMHHHGSCGLVPLLEERRGSFFADLSAVCLSVNFWSSPERRGLTFSVLGLCVFHVCVSRDSRQYRNGSVMNECMNDLLFMMDGLADKQGNILIPNIYDGMLPLNEQEQIIFSSSKISLNNFENKIGINDFNKGNLLYRQWKYPSLSIHKIFTSPGNPSKIVMPKSVYATFSIRIAPGQKTETIEKIVTNFMKEKWNKRNSPNKFKIRMSEHREPWWTDSSSKIFKTAMEAGKAVYGVTPLLTLEGGRYWSPSKIYSITGNEVILMPLCSVQGDLHTEYEQLKVEQYIKGIKFVAAFLHLLPKTLESTLGICV